MAVVLHKGELRKVKSNKKRFFVLYDDKPELDSFGRFCYFEKQTQFEKSTTPKRIFKLDDLISLESTTRETKTKQNVVIALFSCDDLLVLETKDRSDADSWKADLLAVREKVWRRKNSTEPPNLFDVCFKGRLLSSDIAETKLLLRKDTPCVMAFSEDLTALVFQNSLPDNLASAERANTLEMKTSHLFDKVIVSDDVVELNLYANNLVGAGRLKVKLESSDAAVQAHSHISSHFVNQQARTNELWSKRMGKLGRTCDRLQRGQPSSTSQTAMAEEKGESDDEGETETRPWGKTTATRPIPVPRGNVLRKARSISTSSTKDGHRSPTSSEAHGRSRENSMFSYIFKTGSKSEFVEKSSPLLRSSAHSNRPITMNMSSAEQSSRQPSSRGSSFSFSPNAFLDPILRNFVKHQPNEIDKDGNHIPRSASISSQNRSNMMLHEPVPEVAVDESADHFPMQFPKAQPRSRTQSYTSSSSYHHVGPHTHGSIGQREHLNSDSPDAKRSQVEASRGKAAKENRRTVSYADAPFLLADIQAGQKALHEWSCNNEQAAPVIVPFVPGRAVVVEQGSPADRGEGHSAYTTIAFPTKQRKALAVVSPQHNGSPGNVSPQAVSPLAAAPEKQVVPAPDIPEFDLESEDHDSIVYSTLDFPVKSTA